MTPRVKGKEGGREGRRTVVREEKKGGREEKLFSE